MKVKVCGLKSDDDACAALDAGAWALGFVFYPLSRRFIPYASNVRRTCRTWYAFAVPAMDCRFISSRTCG